ncbi:hypothetical protein [Cellulomonas soli]
MLDPTSYDRTVPRPAILLTGRHRRSRGLLFATFAVLCMVGGTWGLAYEATHGWSGRGERWGQELPAWPFYLAYLVFGAVALLRRGRVYAPWYQRWSYVELVEDGGLRLFVGRLGPRQDGLPVRRGETVTIDARLRGRPGHGVGRDYDYRISAPAGELAFHAEGYIHRLTMEPLVSRADVWGITVATTGEATRIQRVSRPVGLP